MTVVLWALCAAAAHRLMLDNFDLRLDSQLAWGVVCIFGAPLAVIIALALCAWSGKYN